MEDERVDRLLRTLHDAPPATASAGFTDRVLARLDAPHSGASANWLPRLTLPAVALAATFVVAASLLFTNGRLPAHPPATRPLPALAGGTSSAILPAVQAAASAVPLRASASDARVRRLLAQIRSEQASLESDLHRLRRAGGQPVLYVGGDDQVDLIVNLDRVRQLPTRRRRAQADPGVSPEALSNQTF